jgi:hypothetical protein
MYVTELSPEKHGGVTLPQQGAGMVCPRAARSGLLPAAGEKEQPARSKV